MKCEKIDWQATATMRSIVAEMTFENFEQSTRFMNVIINFLREERAIAQASEPPKAALSQNDFAEQGEISRPTQQSSGPDGQCAEQAGAGSVT